MTTLAEFKSNFYDLQRQQANQLETLLNEIVSLNQKIKDLTPEPKTEKKVK